MGHDETNSGSISTTIKNAITVSLGEIFSYTLDISTTTGKCSNHKFHYKSNQKITSKLEVAPHALKMLTG